MPACLSHRSAPSVSFIFLKVDKERAGKPITKLIHPGKKETVSQRLRFVNHAAPDLWVADVTSRVGQLSCNRDGGRESLPGEA